MDILFFFITLALMLPGLAGIILPMFPGIPYMWVLSVIYALTTSFNVIDRGELIVLTVVLILSLFVDYFSGLLGAKLGGASLKSIGWGMVGLFIGLFTFPPFGGVVGMFLGVVASEINDYKPDHLALRAGVGGVIGSLAGVITNLLLGFTFLIAFILSAIL